MQKTLSPSNSEPMINRSFSKETGLEGRVGERARGKEESWRIANEGGGFFGGRGGGSKQCLGRGRDCSSRSREKLLVGLRCLLRKATISARRGWFPNGWIARASPPFFFFSSSFLFLFFFLFFFRLVTPPSGFLTTQHDTQTRRSSSSFIAMKGPQQAWHGAWMGMGFCRRDWLTDLTSHHT